MTEAHAAPPGSPAGLLDDWITIWHSEIAAAINDPELHETLLHLVDLWAAEAHRIAASAFDLARIDVSRLDPRHAGSLAPPRPASAAAAPDGHAAPDGRDAVIAGLLARVAELERRLDGPRPPGDAGPPRDT